MSWSPLQAILTLVGGLVLAAIIGWVKRPRLIVLVPRLFSHSVLTNKGQLAEVSVFNRGLKTEENIEVSLSPGLRYEIVGSSSQDLRLVGEKISVPRLGAGDDVTVLLLVEGGVFGPGDITNCLSKETKGQSVTSHERVPPTGQQRIGLIALLIVFPAAMYGIFLGMDWFFTKTEAGAAAAAAGTPAQKPAVLDGWQIASSYVFLKGPLFRAFEQGTLKLIVGAPKRTGDRVSVSVTIRNAAPLLVSASVSMTSQKSAGKIPSYELSEHNIAVPSGGTATRTITVIVPKDSTSVLDRQIYIKVHMEENGGDSLQLTRTLEVLD